MAASPPNRHFDAQAVLNLGGDEPMIGYGHDWLNQTNKVFSAFAFKVSDLKGRGQVGSIPNRRSATASGNDQEP